MMLAYTYVRGKKQLGRLLERMGVSESPTFTGAFARCGGITVEIIYDRPGVSGPYFDYYILTMPHRNGTMSSISDVRSEVRKSIREGERGMMKV